MKNLALLLFSLLLLSCSSSDDDNGIPPKPTTAKFTYSVEGLISFTKGGSEIKSPLFVSVSYKDASGSMVTEDITSEKWEKTIILSTDKLFSSKLVLKYNRVENADDDKVSITRKNIISYSKDGEILKISDTSSTMTMSTNQLNTSLEKRGDYESTYDVTFD